MKSRERWLAAALLATIALGPASAGADPIQWSGNGHWYELVEDVVTWPEAEMLAEARSWNEKPGYLATITSAEENAFIRPSPSGGTLGGVAGRTRETMAVCEAAGYDVIIIETVGVGQSETAVASMVDFFLVLMLAGAGDELQGIKKGILELADAIAINKADGDNLQKAQRARKEYENALHYLRPDSPNWTPPVLTCSALNMVGMDAIWSTVMAHHRKLEASGELGAKRRQQALAWMWTLLEEGLKERFYQHPAVKRRLPEVIASVERGDWAPTRAAGELLFLLDKEPPVSDG